jgi:hypothetical protein
LALDWLLQKVSVCFIRFILLCLALISIYFSNLFISYFYTFPYFFQPGSVPTPSPTTVYWRWRWSIFGYGVFSCAFYSGCFSS